MLSEESRHKRKQTNARWDRDNTKQVKCKFNLRTDDDILKHLQKQGNVQGYLKRLIREDIAKSKPDGNAAESFE